MFTRAHRLAQLTPRDMARATLLLLDEIGVKRVHAVVSDAPPVGRREVTIAQVGASLGGCVALCVVSGRNAAAAAAASSSPTTVADATRASGGRAAKLLQQAPGD